MTNKTTAELIAWLDKDLETQKTLLTDFADGDAFEEEVNDCALHYQAIKDRLAEMEAALELKTKAINAYMLYVRANLGKDAEYFGDEVYQHVMRGGSYNGEPVGYYDNIADTVPDYLEKQALQPKGVVKDE